MNKKELQEEVKKLQTENDILTQEINKPQKSSFWEIINSIIGTIGIIGSIIALIISLSANSFTKTVSPLTYSFDVSNKNSTNIMPALENNDVIYNISDIVINIDNEPGSISNLYIARLYTSETNKQVIDIRQCEEGNDVGVVFDTNFILKYNYEVNNRSAKFSTGFNSLGNEKYGYFFIILKSYSGNYYYNIVHYIINDTPQIDEETGLNLINTQTELLKITDIYDRDKIKSICTEINSKNYITSKIDIDDYIIKLENDYKLLKDKLEG